MVLKKIRLDLLLVFCLSIIYDAQLAACAQSKDFFYAGKRITLIIGAGSGATYDIMGRVIARHLRNHLAGNPSIVPHNMPGASQIRATEYAYNLAPRDGTSLLIAQPSIVLHKLLNPSARYDVHDFSWIGRVQPAAGVGIVWHRSPIFSVEDAKSRGVVFGANSPSGPQSMLPTALNRYYGTLFKVITGYESEHRLLLAMENGEISGIGNVMSDFLSNSQGWITRGLVRPIFAASLNRLSRLPQVPTIMELTSTEKDRAVMRIMAAISELGLNLMGPPGVPVQLVQDLRLAFDTMVADASFIQELSGLGFTPDPMTGDDLAKFISSNFKPSEELVARLKETTVSP